MIEGMNEGLLRDIVAAGETRHVVHSGRAGARASIIAPAVIVEEMDLREPPAQTSKKPHTKHPAF
jgi:hypothetical protein